MSIEKLISKIKYYHNVIMTDSVSKEFDDECKNLFMKYFDMFYNTVLVLFSIFSLISLYFFTTRAIF